MCIAGVVKEEPGQLSVVKRDMSGSYKPYLVNSVLKGALKSALDSIRVRILVAQYVS
jgi:hypothetical protein